MPKCKHTCELYKAQSFKHKLGQILLIAIFFLRNVFMIYGRHAMCPITRPIFRYSALTGKLAFHKCQLPMYMCVVVTDAALLSHNFCPSISTPATVMVLSADSINAMLKFSFDQSVNQ